MLSHIPYMYVDEAGCKQHDDIYLDAVLANPSELAEIEAKLQDGEFFIPAQLNLGIPELQSRMEGFPSARDHVFHTMCLYEFEEVASAPEGAFVVSAQEFLARFRALSGPDAWDVVAAHTRLGL